MKNIFYNFDIEIDLKSRASMKEKYSKNEQKGVICYVFYIWIIRNHNQLRGVAGGVDDD